MNEVTQNESWMYQTGRKINSRSMYKFWGFYDETADARYQEEFGQAIANHGIILEAGDAVYVDLNGDGKLDGNVLRVNWDIRTYRNIQPD